MNHSEFYYNKILSLMRELYADADAAFEKLKKRLESVRLPESAPKQYYGLGKHVTLITYGDSVRRDGEVPLRTLHGFLNAHIKGAENDPIDTVHILPFYPYTSDDGFSVTDYYAINPALGDWDDVRAMSNDYRLMFDAVVNHMSAQSEWFKRFLDGDPAYQTLFMTESPDTDLSMVTRPRTSPLLTPFTKADGSTVHVWTTFSADQVDLDFRNSDTLLRMLDVLLFYVEQGAQVIRLDAIAFLWKRAGTTSLHLPETHKVIKIINAALSVAAQYVEIITETNVPHAENISYFGHMGDEAQLVYNFTLPPLLLHSLITGDVEKFAAWINTLDDVIIESTYTNYFNFTASHDGIGVRPVEGILSPDELDNLIRHVESCGGRVSYRTKPDGSQSPYELNITYVDAAGAPRIDEETHIARFLLTQAVMLVMDGIPAVYIHSLLGSRNDYEGLARLGYNRAINRAKLDAEKVIAELADPNSFRAKVYSRYMHMLRVRERLRAFNPGNYQEAYTHGKVLYIVRGDSIGGQSVDAVFNISHEPQLAQINLSHWIHKDFLFEDQLTGEQFISNSAIPVPPYGVRWLVPRASLEPVQFGTSG
jgi:glucosylglycerate phosphorylase